VPIRHLHSFPTRRSSDLTPEKLEEMKRRGVTRAYAVSVLCYLVTAYVMALLASYTNSTTLAQGLWLGFLSWLGFAATGESRATRSEEHTSELQSRGHLVC